MTIRTRITLLVLLVAGGIALSIVTVQNSLLRQHLVAGQKEWVETLVRAVAEGVAGNTIDGDKLQARAQLLRIVSKDAALEYMYVIDFEGHLFAHTFDGGFPKVLASRLHSSDHHEITFFSMEGDEINETTASLIEGMDAHLHVGVNQDEIEALVAAAQNDQIRIVVLVTVIGLAVSLWIGSRMSHPLRNLAEQIHRHGEKANDAKVEVDTSEPDIRNLATAFNDMIAARSQAETDLEDSEEKVRRSQKMDAIGQLTGGIAHDFNNMLGVVMGNLELVRMEGNLDDATEERLGNAFIAAERGAELTKKLLGFARTSAQGTKITPVNDTVINLENLFAKSLTAAIDIENNLADDLWLTDIDPADLEDTLLNLSINARDAMPDGGTLTFETANKVLDGDYVRQNPGSRTGEFVMIAVSDSGIGMPREIHEKIFEPFFSTKEEGKGTGLGLSMVYGFVQRSGGHIKVYSEPGKGTAFRIFLPRASVIKNGTENAAAAEHEMPIGAETILVVDDEQDLVDIVVYRLEGLGYSVLTANSGEQALQTLKDNPGVDLLFSDIIMPGELDGYRLAQAAAEFRPSLKILLTSGFAKKQAVLMAGEAEVIAKLTNNMLGKPYNYSELATSVRRALD